MENLAPIYNILSIVAFIIAGISLAAAIFMWFKFGILKIIGDLSGRTAKKTIEQKRSENEKKGRDAHYSTNIEKEGRAPDNADKKSSKTKKDGKNSNKAKNKSFDKHTKLLENLDATTKIDEEKATELLSDGTIMLDDVGTTAMGDGTVVLKHQKSKVDEKNMIEFRVIQELIFLATDETI